MSLPGEVQQVSARDKKQPHMLHSGTTAGSQQHGATAVKANELDANSGIGSSGDLAEMPTALDNSRSQQSIAMNSRNGSARSTEPPSATATAETATATATSSSEASNLSVPRSSLHRISGDSTIGERNILLRADGQRRRQHSLHNRQLERLPVRSINDHERSLKTRRISHSTEEDNSNNTSSIVPHGTSSEQPLIHTDHFNATTRLLYIYPPQNSHSRRQKQKQLLMMTARNGLAGEEQTAESNVASERVSVFGAMGERRRGSNKAQKLLHETSKLEKVPPLLPRLDIINLEVTKSAATITWTLSLHSALDERDQDPTREGEEEEDSPGRRIINKRDTIRVTPTLSSSNKLLRATEREVDDQGESIRTRRERVNGGSGDDGGGVQRETEDQNAEESQAENSDKHEQNLPTTVNEESSGNVGFGNATLELVRTTSKKKTILSPNRISIQPLQASNQTWRRPPTRQSNQTVAIGSAGKHSTTATNDTLSASPPIKVNSNRTREGPRRAETAIPIRLEISSQTSNSNSNITTPARNPAGDIGRLGGRVSKLVNSTNQQVSNEHSHDLEPPMIRVPSVILNRIPNKQSPVISSTTTTTTPTTVSPNHFAASTISEKISHIDLNRSSKSLKLEDNEASSESKGFLSDATRISSSRVSTKSEMNLETIQISTSTTAPPTISTTEKLVSSHSDQSESTGNNSSSTAKPAELSTVKPTTVSTKSIITAANSTTQSPIVIARKQQLVTRANWREASVEDNLDDLSSDEAPRQTSAVASTKSSTPTTLRPIEFDARKPTLSSSSTTEVTSKWLVRLRRFGSNEVDIVKVVVTNLQQHNSMGGHARRPPLRSISFKNLEPSSAYEICVESASPNQQIQDKYNILNANHFLKCQDTSEVELSSGEQQLPQATNVTGGDQSVKRMDLMPMPLPKASTESLSPLFSENPRAEMATSSNLVSETSTKIGDKTTKLKSLCREFFTLHQNSSEQLILGLHLNQSDAKMFVDEFGGHGGESTLNEQIQPISLDTNSTSYNNSTNNLRKPKSLLTTLGSGTNGGGGGNNLLGSRLELLEINDTDKVQNGRPLMESPQASVFEMFSSRVGRTQAVHDLTRATATQQPFPTIGSGVGNHFGPYHEANGTSSLGQDYLSASILPLVGCVFALIFIATLANILLNALNCSTRSGHRTSVSSSNLLSAAVSRRNRRRRHGDGSPSTSMLTNRRQLDHHHSSNLSGSMMMPFGRIASGLNGSGSYGESSSDHSGTSPSRIVVVGKHGEPYASASAYFDVPLRHQPDLSPHGNSSSRSGGHGADSPTVASLDGPNRSGSSAFHLLSESARFPLGPSFEGDGRHNADMVGLARRNYDNFINNIYNNTEIPISDLAAAAKRDELELGYKSQPATLPSNFSHRDISKTSKQEQGAVRKPHRHSSQDVEQGDLGNLKHDRTRQRIRFDKVNPIYNMDGIQLSQSRILARQSVSSFGHHAQQSQSQPLQAAPPNNELGSSNQGTAAALNCQLCEEHKQHSSSSGSNSAMMNPAANSSSSSSSSTCELHNNCDVNNTVASANPSTDGPYFKCCLDKQQQRFQAQQQQLERVLTKNGSLVPQPFINTSTTASEADEQNSLQQQQKQEYPQQQLSSQDISLRTMSTYQEDSLEVKQPPVQTSGIGARTNLPQHDRDTQEMVETKMPTSVVPCNQNKETRSTKDSVEPSRGSFMFGDEPKRHSVGSQICTDVLDRVDEGGQTPPINASSSPLPHMPPPPTPLSPASSPIPKTNESSRSAGQLPNVSFTNVSDSSATYSRATSETIKKTDFDQRRSELESKLHLPGMTKP